MADHNHIKLIVEEHTPDGEIVSREIIKELDLKGPKQITDLGVCHKEQINFLQGILDVLISKQSALIDWEETCPRCGNQTMKSGVITSNFHSVFTDHEVKLQRRVCSCGWQNKSSVCSRFGNSSHPDLLEMQCEEGAGKSYKKAERTLEKRCYGHRAVNNSLVLSVLLVKLEELLVI